MAAALGMAIGCSVWAAGTSPANKPGAAPTARNVDVQAVADSHPQYWFGVAVENIPSWMSEQLTLTPEQGVLVSGVFPGTPAEKAGLIPHDVLIELNGHPLTSQEDLARAANTASEQKMGASTAPPALMQISEITYLRKGARHTARVTPELRPTSMQVTGANIDSFYPNAKVEVPANRPLPTRNIVLSSGVTASVGPGYPVDAGESLKVLQQAVGKGQTVTITQQTDASGKVKNTISDGQKSYVVDADNLQNMPENFRPLAQEMLASARRTSTPVVPAPVAPAMAPRMPEQMADKVEGTGTMEERLRNLEQQNRDLRKQIEELVQRMIQNGGTTQPASVPTLGQ